MISLLKNKYRTDSVIHYFNLSIILPFYKKTEGFCRVIAINAPFFQRNGIEVVIILDDPSEEYHIIEFIKGYPFINWKIIKHTHVGIGCSLSKIINIGIRHATMRYVMITSSEAELITDAIYLLRETLEYYPNHYTYGQIVSAAFDEDISVSGNQTCLFGNIMVEKCIIEKIGGYDENRTILDGNNELKTRLEMSGVRKLFIPDAILVHRKNSNAKEEWQAKCMYLVNQNYIPMPPLILNPNGDNWGIDFSTVCYDWQFDGFDLNACYEYLDRFIDFKIKKGEDLKERKKLIILAPARNEEEFITEFIEHMSKLCDGIIFLDDGSNDNTYELMKGDKVLLKVRKENSGFNDIANRNILLDIASFFNSEWFLFMDIDEEFDMRFCKLDTLINCKELDVCIFNFIHLWNSKDTYNTLYPKSKDGIVEICRMFRSKGHLQINTSKTLHFPSVPYYAPLNQIDKSILVLHKGHLSKEKRMEKYSYYLQEDKKGDQLSYEYLIDDSVVLAEVLELKL